jgi:hypothetical protein
MPSCEKCWRDSQSIGVEYGNLVEARNTTGVVCTPEEQAGDDAGLCPSCNRRTLHQHTGDCMAGCQPTTPPTVTKEGT